MLFRWLFILVILACCQSVQAVSYYVQGELVEVQNNRGAQQRFNGDDSPDFEGLWDVDIQSARIDGNFLMGSYCR